MRAIRAVLIWLFKIIGTTGLAIAKGTIAVAGTAGKLIWSAAKFLAAHPELAKALTSGIIAAASYDEIKTLLAGKGVPTDQVEAYLDWLKSTEKEYGSVSLDEVEKETNRLTEAAKQQVRKTVTGSGNHPDWWAPKGWRTSVQYMNEQLKPTQRYWAFANVKHMSFYIPEIDLSRLESMDSVIEAFFRRYAVFGDATPPQNELDRYRMAFRDIIQNSVAAYAFMSDLMRSQNSRDLRLQGSTAYGKLLTPVHYVPRNVPETEALLDYVPSDWFYTDNSDDETANLQYNVESAVPKPVDNYAEMKVSNDMWSRMMKILRSSSYIHKNTIDYIDYMVRSIHADSEGKSTSELILFYPATLSLVSWNENTSSETNFAVGPASTIGTADQALSFMLAFESAQGSILNRFPALLPLLKYLGLCAMDVFKDSKMSGRNSREDARASLNLFDNSSRDPSHSTLPVLQMDRAFAIASKNAVVIEPSLTFNKDPFGWVTLPYATISIPVSLANNVDGEDIKSNLTKALKDYLTASYTIGVPNPEAWTSAIHQFFDVKRVLLPAPPDSENYSQDAVTTFKPTNSSIDTGTLFAYTKWSTSSPLFLHWITTLQSDGTVRISKSVGQRATPVKCLIMEPQSDTVEEMPNCYFIAVNLSDQEYRAHQRLAMSLNAKSAFCMAPIATDEYKVRVADNIGGMFSRGGSYNCKVGIFDENDQLVEVPEDWKEQCNTVWFYNQTGLLDFSDLADKANDIVNMYTFS